MNEIADEGISKKKDRKNKSKKKNKNNK